MLANFRPSPTETWPTLAPHDLCSLQHDMFVAPAKHDYFILLCSSPPRHIFARVFPYSSDVLKRCWTPPTNNHLIALCGGSLDRFRVPRSGQCLANFDHQGPNLGRSGEDWPNLVEFGQWCLAEVGLLWPRSANVGRSWPSEGARELAKSWANVGQKVGRILVVVCALCLSKPALSRPKFRPNWPISPAESGLPGQFWGSSRATFGQLRSSLDSPGVTCGKARRASLSQPSGS